MRFNIFYQGMHIINEAKPPKPFQKDLKPLRRRKKTLPTSLSSSCPAPQKAKPPPPPPPTTPSQPPSLQVHFHIHCLFPIHFHIPIRLSKTPKPKTSTSKATAPTKGLFKMRRGGRGEEGRKKARRGDARDKALGLFKLGRMGGLS